MLNGTCPHCGGHLEPEHLAFAVNLQCDTCPFESEANPQAIPEEEAHE